MSHDPHAVPIAPEFQDSRTSVLAILAVVCSILCLPPFGLVAIVLGGVSLTLISRAKGRLEGRGAAIVGMILGVITTTLWVAISFGILQGWTYYTKNLVATGDTFFRAAAQQDFDGARAVMTEAAGADLSDEQITWFVSEVETHEGSISGAATSFRTMIDAFKEVFGQNGGRGNPNTGVTIQKEGNQNVVPVAIECQNGPSLAWIVFDQDSLGRDVTGGPKIVDLFVLFGDGDIVALRRDGPALEAAGRSGMGHPSVEEPPAPPVDGVDATDSTPEPEPVEPPTS